MCFSFFNNGCGGCNNCGGCRNRGCGCNNGGFFNNGCGGCNNNCPTFCYPCCQYYRQLVASFRNQGIVTMQPTDKLSLSETYNNSQGYITLNSPDVNILPGVYKITLTTVISADCLDEVQIGVLSNGNLIADSFMAVKRLGNFTDTLSTTFILDNTVDSALSIANIGTVAFDLKYAVMVIEKIKAN